MCKCSLFNILIKPGATNQQGIKILLHGETGTV